MLLEHKADASPLAEIGLQILKNANPRYAFDRRPTQISAIVDPQEAFVAKAALLTLGRFLLGAMAVLQTINFVSFSVLIGLYFKQVDGEFTVVQCGTTHYCSNAFVLRSDCVQTTNKCRADLLETIPVLTYMSVSQSLIFFLNYWSVEQSADLRGFEKWTVLLTSKPYLVVVFFLSAFALPFGYKQGSVAFSIMENTGLHITAIVAGAILLIVMADKVTGCLPKTWNTRMSWMFRAAPLCLLCHAAASFVYHWIVHADFVNASIFFIALDKEYLAYSFFRTLFSVASIIQALCAFVWGNVYKRFNVKEDRNHISIKSLSPWLQVALLGPFVGPFFILFRGSDSIESEQLMSQATTLDDQGQFEEALVFYDKALQIRLKQLGPDHPDVATTYNNMAMVYDSQGLYDKALEFYGKSLQINLKQLGPDHPDVAQTYNNMAVAYDSQGLYEKALEFYGKALQIKLKQLGPDHPDVALTYNNMAIMYQNQGLYDKALELYGKALQINLKQLGPDHPSVAQTYNNMAVAYDSQGLYEKALEFYGKALQIKLKQLGPDHPHVAATYHNMAVVYGEQGLHDKALEFYGKALDIRLKQLGPDHPDVAQTYNNMAVVYDSQGLYEKALEFCGKSLQIGLKQLGPDHPSMADTYNNMAGVYEKQGLYDKALEFHDKALQIRLKQLGPDHPSVALTYYNMALVYKEQGLYEKALDLYQKAVVIAESKLGANHPDTQDYRQGVKNALEALGRQS